MRTAVLILVVAAVAILSLSAGSTSTRSARPASSAPVGEARTTRPALDAPLPSRDVRRFTAAAPLGDTDRLAAALERRRHDPPELVRVPGSSTPVGEGRLRRYTVEVEPMAGIDAGSFASAVEAILSDPRSWTADGSYALQRVDRGRVDLRVTLATPESADALCWPLDTRGTQSCWNEDRAVINAFRWEQGAATYGMDLDAYRAYLVNHEVGHGLGHGHVDCPGAGQLAPVMLQQTITLDGCRPNPWPFPELTP